MGLESLHFSEGKHDAALLHYFSCYPYKLMALQSPLLFTELLSVVPDEAARGLSSRFFLLSMRLIRPTTTNTAT